MKHVAGCSVPSRDPRPRYTGARLVWQWLDQQYAAMHCHRAEAELRDRIAGFEVQVNDEPSAVHRRLRSKTRLLSQAAIS